MCKYIGNVGACRSATILDITFHEFVLMISAEIMLKVENNGQWESWISMLIQYEYQYELKRGLVGL